MSKEFNDDKELKEIENILSKVLIDEEKNNYKFEVNDKKKQGGYMKKILAISVLASLVIGFASNSFFSNFKSKGDSNELLKYKQNATENNEKKYDNHRKNPYENKAENNYRNNRENHYGNEGGNPYNNENKSPYGNKKNGKDFSGSGGEPSKIMTPAQKASEI